MAMDNVSKQDPCLFILLGLDTLYSIKLKQLEADENQLKGLGSIYTDENQLKGLGSIYTDENEADLQIVFSHGTHVQSEEGKNYPLGMGLFVQDSKLHFFGGENIAPHNHSFSNINFEMGRKPGDKSSGLFNETFIHSSSPKWGAPEWINKEVFSFNPILNNQPSILITPDKSNPLPNHKYYKVRPIVFTISGKVYALATKPYMGSLVEAQSVNDQIVFEVFEPKGNGEWHWNKLPNPPIPLYRAILGYPDAHGVSRTAPMLHFVFRSKLVFLGNCGDYLFDVIARKWATLPYNEDLKDISNCTTLEYKNHLLVFLDFKLLDLSSFGEFEGSFGGYESIHDNTILDIRDVLTLSYPITASSLSRVDNNCICVVFITYIELHVCLFQVIENPCVEVMIKVKFKGHRLFQLPRVLANDPYILSTFQLPRAVDPREEYVGKSNKIFTDPIEENQGSTVGSNSVIFVRNLPVTITNSRILEMFDGLRFGKIKRGRVFLNPKYHFAFVEFEDIQSLNKALKASPIHFDGKKVYMEKVDDASQSCSLWWKREQRKALKGRGVK